jgi:uncharacterized MAPEG superfamily protein
MQTIGMTTELQVLAWSVVLGLVTIVAQASVATLGTGIGYNMSARDDGRSPPGTVAPRLKRALDNYLETWPAFIALALALAVSGKSGGSGAAGALVWIIARVIYVPVYAAGIPVIRTLLWLGSIVGLVMMLIRLMA